jgi:hypothetical protein
VVLLLDLIMSFLCTVFFLGFRKLHVQVWFFSTFFILFGCWQFSLTLTTMISYCPRKALGEGGLVQIWTPNQRLHNQDVLNCSQASLSYIFTLPTYQFVCVDKNNGVIIITSYIRLATQLLYNK